jgi:hypothetical protein
MNLDALREQALATMLPAARKDRAAILRLHAGAKSKLAFAGPLRGLVSAFHGRMEKEGEG